MTKGINHFLIDPASNRMWRMKEEGFTMKQIKFLYLAAAVPLVTSGLEQAEAGEQGKPNSSSA